MSHHHASSPLSATGWALAGAVIEPAAVEALRLFLEEQRLALERRFEAWVASQALPPGPYAEHQGRIAAYESRGLPSDFRHFLTGEFDLETRLDTRIARLLASEGCREVFRRFPDLSTPLVHYPPMVRFKMPHAGVSVVPAHQDAAYNRHLEDFVTVWVPLVDVDEACGGVVVYEATRGWPLVSHSPSGAWSRRADASLDPGPPRHVLMRAGDALLFTPLLLHESAPNVSERVRYSVDFRVFASPSASTKSYFDPATGTVTRRD